MGRSAELATLRALLPREASERGRLALVGGEAGCGKSRLVRELAREVAAEDVLVLYGACDAVVQTPYGPFTEALEQLARATDPQVLRADLGGMGGELSRLLPDLSARVGGLPDPISADPDTERHRLHTAVADLLAGAGARRPLLLVLEDIHWADGPTLVLLRHLARSGGVRVLVLATFRDADADVPAELAGALADLRRLDHVVRLRLGPLSAEDIGEFARRAGGGDIDPAGLELSAELRGLTQGNAFLLCELWRALLETGALDSAGGVLRLRRPLHEIATPESVREVVSQRLARLDAATRDLLELAAVAGTEFELEVLKRAAPRELERRDALQPAVASGMIIELALPALGYRFTHELVRRALYDRLGALRRAELHLQLARALEDSGRPLRGRQLADLAHHYAQAAPVAGAERAVEYNLLAAQAASAALAYDEATARLRAALGLGIEEPRARAEVLVDLGTVLFRAGRSFESLDAFKEAAAIARELDAGELLSRAAIGFEATCWRPGLADQGARELLEEASERLADEDSALRVGVLAGLARALEFEGASERAAEERGEAIAMARRIDDRRGLAYVLTASYWASSTTSLRDVLEMLTEAGELARELGDIEAQAEAGEWRVSALLALGDIDAAREELAVASEAVKHTRQPFIMHVAEHFRSALALLEGRLAEAEEAAERSHELGQLLVGRDASGVYGIQMFSVRREQGRLAELAPVIRMLASGDRAGAAWRPGLAAMLAELAMPDQATEELDRVCAEGLASLRNRLWLASLTYLTDAAAAVGHAELAGMVYPLLAPMAGTNVMIGHGVSCYGSADRYLGMLAATLGDHALAARHFEAALDSNRRMGARTWLAHSAYEYGRTMLGGEEHARGEQLLAEAVQIASEVGMPALAARAHALVDTPSAPAPDGLSQRELDVLRLVARGLSNREIGAELFISEHTAANHVRSILRKSGAANRTEATAYAYRRGLAGEPRDR